MKEASRFARLAFLFMEAFSWWRSLANPGALALLPCKVHHVGKTRPLAGAR